MHPALRVVELVQMIFEEVACPVDDASPGLRSSARQTRLGTLAALSRTCKRFQDPAIDVLWKNQTSLECLFSYTLPSDVWIEMKDRNRLPKSSDWVRVLFYSSRIKEITLSSGDENLWEQARISLPRGTSLLPNLRHLHWQMNIGLVSTMPSFLGPRLVSLDLQVYGWQLSNLPKLAPLLPSPVELKIELKTPSTPTQPIFFRQASLFICGLNMTRLEVTNLDAPALLHISQLPLLSFLSLLPDYECPCTFSPSSFPALRTLELTCNRNPEELKLHVPAMKACYSDCLISFITAHPNWNLESIAIKCAPMHAVLEALHNHCTHSTLTRLEVGLGAHHYMTSYPPRSTADIARIKLPSGAVRPLLAFTQLRALALKSPIGIDLDKTTFWQMALAWPHLESLALTAYDPVPMLALPFDALRALAQHCPRLLSLKVPVNGYKYPDLPAETPHEQRRVALTAAHTWLAEHAVVADFASRINPTTVGWGQWANASTEYDDEESDESDEYDLYGDEYGIGERNGKYGSGCHCGCECCGSLYD
ncbi:hypothetical protein FB451DRAFT_1385932 [Mycena latifolia]|nr:hypothetical protein FB451DRAFT_1385932 [Mycena latifolia]